MALDETQVKKIVKSIVVPYITGLRNEIEEGNKILANIFEEQKKKSELQYELEIDNDDLKGAPGYTPIPDVDYPSIASIKAEIEKILPKKGKDYFTSQDITEIIKGVLKLMPPPARGLPGKNGVVNYTLVRTLAKPLVDEKYKELRREMRDMESKFVSMIKASEKPEISAVRIVEKLESLKGSARLSSKAIKDLEGLMNQFFIACGGGGGNAASSGGGGFTIEIPSGSLGQNSFTVTEEPAYVVADGITYFDGAGYAYSGGTITMNSDVQFFIRSFY